MHYCLVICRVSSTGHIYHRAAKRRGDKFDRSMTRGKLLGNNAPIFIFISILIMTQLISFLHFLLTAVRTGRLGVLPIKIYRGNNAVFVSVELIGEKNQVILEYAIYPEWRNMLYMYQSDEKKWKSYGRGSLWLIDITIAQ